MYLFFLQDYIDGFDKLLRLGLKSQQEREIVYIIVDFCLQEKKYNFFYMLLLQKFCFYYRRFQVNFLLKKLMKLICCFRNRFGIKFIFVSIVVLQFVEYRLKGKILVMQRYKISVDLLIIWFLFVYSLFVICYVLFLYGIVMIVYIL